MKERIEIGWLEEGIESKPNWVFVFFSLNLKRFNVFKCYWVGMRRKEEIVVRDSKESLRWFYKFRRSMMSH